jgi:[glutamine synthetase] adenylyltransferase / [glutamine synthetase]-adenylyl-L-tyrosine phosphorylase
MTSVSVQKMNEAIDRAESNAPYLRMLMARLPDTVERFLSGSLNDVEPKIDGSLPVRTALRQAKARQALSLALADLAGMLTLEQVTTALSDFADTALHLAIGEAIDHVVPGAPNIGFAAIALGKHGSRELNYSSDIDPILIFDPAVLPRRQRDDPTESAVRIGRRMIETMQTRDGDGYVFRTDLRLRPTPEVTPIAMPIGAAITYYESQARPWERAAFIRARASAGDMALGQSFLDAIRPFVWRRGLDFGAIGEIREISRRIRNHHASGQVFGLGFDLKRGRGGIREVEFFAQINQLIYGGRQVELRCAATLQALTALAQADRISDQEATALGEAYRLYRTIEHRLQMVDDQQTHAIPQHADALDHVAKLHGLPKGQDLLELLAPHVEIVGRIYDSLDGGAAAKVSDDESRLISDLRSAGYADPAHAAQRISHWRSGAVRALRTTAAQNALEAVLPHLLTDVGKAPDANQALNQFSNLIERLPSAINLFRLLEARPGLLRLLIAILSHAPTLAEQLAVRVSLLDRLIDASAFDPIEAVGAVMDAMRVDSDLESQLDQVRHYIGDHRFALGVQVIEGLCDPLDVAKGYARLAEAAVGVVANASIAAFETQHGRVPDSELVVLALGRMGGAELTHKSDLDLIFLFTGNFSAVSDGAKPLGAVHYYNRLAQRVIAGLSVPTAAGSLYDVDTRLRPSGAKGPLAISLTAFEKYQREDAWSWEHMALTRARVIYGTQSARRATQLIIETVLNLPRDPRTLKQDAVKMRRDMALHKPPGGILDVKLLPGGLVDLEFAVHVQQLTHGVALSPDLCTALKSLVHLGLADKAIVDAYLSLTRFLVTLRLVAPDLETPAPSTQMVVAKACGFDDWKSLLAAISASRQSVAAFWAASSQLEKDA